MKHFVFLLRSNTKAGIIVSVCIRVIRAIRVLSFANVYTLRESEKLIRFYGTKMESIYCDTWTLFHQPTFTPHVLVAEQNGQLLGATVLKLIPLPRNRKGGLIYWVFTAPEASGMRAGQRLIESATHFFEDKGCDEIMTCVEGINTSSSKLFSTRGFSILSPGQQFRR